MEVLIVGAGAMGRWFAEAIDRGETSIAFADVDDTAAREAADAIGGRTVPVTTEERFDVVCLAVPLSVVADAIADHAPKARRAIVDVTGVMATPVEAMREHAPERDRVSFHPLFSPENAPGNVAVVIDAPGPVTDELGERIEAHGNVLFETTAEDHDAAMETVQAKAHAAVLAFALAADDVPEPFRTPVSTGLFDLVETVTGGTPRVYAEIQTAFGGAETVADAAERIADADRDEFEELYREAGRRYRGVGQWNRESNRREDAGDHEGARDREDAVDHEDTREREDAEESQ